MRTLLLSRYGSKGASSRVRHIRYISYLEEHNVHVDVRPLFSNRYLDVLYSGGLAWREVLRGYIQRATVLLTMRHYDLVIIEKELFPYLPAFAEVLLRFKGVPYIVDYDDALFHKYDLHTKRWVRVLLGQKIDAVMRHSSIVVAGNQYLADRAVLAGAREVVLIPTTVDTEQYRPLPKSSERRSLIVGWIGTPKTSQYLLPLLPVFKQIKLRFDVRFVAVGAREAEFHDTPIETWDWSEDTEVSSIQKFDIGIMPLLDSPWERGKCGYKLIQYMACGLPVIASPVGVNREIVVSGENGLFANSTEEWVDAIEHLLGMSSGDRGKMGAAGRKRVVGCYSIEVQAPRLLASIQKAAGKSVT